MKRLMPLLFLLATLTLAAAQADFSRRFETAWRLVDERYWDLDAIGVDWDEVRSRYEPQALAAETEEAFFEVLVTMYEELGDDHSVFVPPARVEEIRALYGDLPCLGVFAQAGDAGQGVSAELMDTILYIRVPDLASSGVASSIRQALRDNPAEGIILDLRGNPGGRLLEMMQVAGVFTGGFLWRTVTTWNLPIPYPALGVTETTLPLAILTDGGVNSAAEGLAGALRANGRAITVGETTAGNVEAVLPFCLRDGSQAWIAAGVLAPVGGPTWEGRGVEPDIATPADEALEAALAYLRDL